MAKLHSLMNKNNGFTLIEVLLALAVVAIALTALIKATSQNVTYMTQLKEKMISQWVAKQGVSMIQLGLLPIEVNQEVTQSTTMLGQSWYWRALVSPTSIKKMQQIRITTSLNQAGPFTNELIAYRLIV